MSVSPQSTIGYLLRAAAALIRSPREGSEQVRERIAERRERRPDVTFYRAEPAWEEALHALLHIGSPCPARAEFDSLWREIMRTLRQKNLPVGRGAFGGWDDVDPAFARATWCLAHHLRPQKVVETGVARGVTTRLILEALERNGSGRLWSIDLPPLLDRRLRGQTAAVVPERLRTRWQYLEGSSRRRLPRLLAALGEIQLFVHDSIHTARNLSFELAHAMPAVSRRGALTADDVHMNTAFRPYADQHTLLCPSDDSMGIFGVVLLGVAPDARPHQQ